MKVTIIVFSPSGHTLKVAQLFKREFESWHSKVQLINITKNEEYLDTNNIKDSLKEDLDEHDVLLIGGPVYAGHVEKNILSTIDQLPEVGEKYGYLAVPFVTYGGVHSSIALEEMGRHIKRKSRKSIIGVKIASEHTLTKAMSKKINTNKPDKFEEGIISRAVEKIMKIAKIDYKKIKDISSSFRYAKLPERILFNTFSQSFFHKKHKNVTLDNEKCIKCKRCIARCPINMFEEHEGIVKMIKDKSQCILCGECYYNCPVEAINYSYIEMAKKRLKDGYAKLEKEQSAIYPKEG
ncbi:EFR1 family ferrodoxin [Clostridiaceae bacterium M8S5]|nr:EFR1 family ferrodoxin [Clostridiaceae bacterium M8S5]